MNWCTHTSPWPSLPSTSPHLRTRHILATDHFISLHFTAFHPNNMKRQDGFSLSESCKSLICSLTDRSQQRWVLRRAMQFRAHYSYQGTKYALSGQSPASTLMSHLPSPTSAPSSSIPACQRLNHLTSRFPAQHTVTLPPLFFLDQRNLPFLGPFPVLVSYWFARWSCESTAVSFFPTLGQWELRSIMPFPSCFLYKPKFPTSLLLGLSHPSTLVSSSAYSSTLKIEVICCSKTSAHFQRTTRRNIPEDSSI
jgi:hypothetical protein